MVVIGGNLLLSRLDTPFKEKMRPDAMSSLFLSQPPQKKHLPPGLPKSSPAEKDG